MYHYFISDLHLEAENDKTASAFFDFLDTHQEQMKSLYILGDFFESWVGDDYRDALIEKIITRLNSLSSDVSLYFMAGNRDFLLGEAFAKLCQLTILQDDQVCNIAGENVLLMHGDSLCTDDHEYQEFKKLSRSEQWQKEVLSKSLEERIAIAKGMRQQSMAAQSNKANNITDANADAIQQAFADAEVNTIIHGHTHRPQIHQYNDKLTRFVLGDWTDHSYILRIDANDASKKEFLKLEF